MSNYQDNDIMWANEDKWLQRHRERERDATTVDIL